MNETELPGFRCWTLAPLAALLVGHTALAHVPMVRGKLVDLVQRSDIVVIGTADSVRAVGPRLVDTTITVQRQLAGSVSDSRLTFRGRTRFAPHERYVFFLRRSASGFEGAQESGTVFPANAEDDVAYRDAVESMKRALTADLANRSDALCAALIPAVSSSARELRYHAALELSALAGGAHQQCVAERQALQRLLAGPKLDPELRVLLRGLAGP